MRNIVIWIGFALFCVVVSHSHALSIGGTEIEAGKIHRIMLDVPAGPADPATRIPVTAIAGVRSGPTLLVVAGVHGYEFAPILASHALVQTVNPSKLAGTLVIVHNAHLPAFEARSPYVNPHDRKNLNRSFPGRSDGTQTERIAYVLSSELIAQADFVFDVHSGDGAEWLAAFVGVYGGPLASDYPLALRVATGFGFPNVVRYSMRTVEQVNTRRSLNRQAVAQGLPTVLVEIGQNGSRDPAHVAAIVQGLTNAMIVLEMLEGDVTPGKPRLFDGTSSVKASTTGTWTPSITANEFIKTGDVLGTLHDLHGVEVETVRSPMDGFALYGLAGPPVRAGDGLITIAKPVESLDPQ
ncbi:MAG: M14 family metallopeptidase [Pseudomonadota bacterium]